MFLTGLPLHLLKVGSLHIEGTKSHDKLLTDADGGFKAGKQPPAGHVLSFN